MSGQVAQARGDAELDLEQALTLENAFLPGADAIVRSVSNRLGLGPAKVHSDA